MLFWMFCRWFWWHVYLTRDLADDSCSPASLVAPQPVLKPVPWPALCTFTFEMTILAIRTARVPNQWGPSSAGVQGQWDHVPNTVPRVHPHPHGPFRRGCLQVRPQQENAVEMTNELRDNAPRPVLSRSRVCGPEGTPRSLRAHSTRDNRRQNGPCALHTPGASVLRHL